MRELSSPVREVSSAVGISCRQTTDSFPSDEMRLCDC